MSARSLGLRALAVCLLALVVVAACGGEDSPAETQGEAHAAGGGVAVYAPRIPAPAGEVAALYLVAVDHEGLGDRLTGVQIRGGEATLHETFESDGRVRMRRAENGFAVPPHGELRLEPGGAHVMLTGLERKLEVGERVHVTLEFERAGRLALEVPVLAADDAADLALAPPVEASGPAATP